MQLLARLKKGTCLRLLIDVVGLELRWDGLDLTPEKYDICIITGLIMTAILAR